MDWRSLTRRRLLSRLEYPSRGESKHSPSGWEGVKKMERPVRQSARGAAWRVLGPLYIVKVPTILGIGRIGRGPKFGAKDRMLQSHQDPNEDSEPQYPNR